jgi:hypothetical protein
MNLVDLVLKYAGMRICVVVGAVDPDLLKAVKADIWIALDIAAAELQSVDYIIVTQPSELDEGGLPEGLLRFNAKTIGSESWCDYQLEGMPEGLLDAPPEIMAPGIAMVLGAHPVILAGFEEDDPETFSGMDCELRVLDGPLAEVLTPYNPKERRKGSYEPGSWAKVFEVGEEDITIVVLKPTQVDGKDCKKGDEFKVSRKAVRRLLKHKIVEET